MEVAINKKDIEYLINKSFIVDNYETSNMVNNKFLKRIKNNEDLCIFCGIIASLFMLLIAIFGGINLFILCLIIGNFPFVLMYFGALMAANKYKKVFKNKYNLLCYGSDNFGVKCTKTYSEGRTNRYICFVFDDGFEISMPFYDFIVEIGEVNKYLKMLNEFDFPEKLRENIGRINIFFYEEIIKKNRKSYIITFDVKEKMD